MNDINGFGYCVHHESYITRYTYELYACWGCYRFHEGKDYPYISAYQASEILGVSYHTILRWIKKGKLDGRLFVQWRKTCGLPAPKEYHIFKTSVEQLKESRRQ